MCPPQAARPRAPSSVLATLVAVAGPGLLGSLLPLLDQLADLVPTLAADLLVERRAALGLDGLAALLADLLVEARAALGLDGVAALLADLLVELAAAGLADADAPLATGLRDRHRALAAALLLLSHG